MMRLVLALICVAVVVLTLPAAQGQGRTSGPNIRVTTEDIVTTDPFVAADRGPRDVLQQNEPHIAQSPLDPGILAAGVNDVRSFGLSGDAWQGIHVSTDGGRTWPFQRLIPGFPGDTSPEGLNSPIRGNRAASDPMVAFDRRGNLYYALIAFQRTPPGMPDFDPQETNAIAVAKYVVTGGNPPVDYQKTVIVEQGTVGLGRQEDKEFMAVDNGTASPHEGNVYLCWARFTGANDHLQFAASADEGETWRIVRVFVGSADTNLQGCSIGVAPNGDVFLAWRSFSTAAAVENPETSAIYVARSTDGGKTFSSAQRVTFFRDYRQNARRSPPIFRTFALTWLAADGTAASYRVFLAWQERDPAAPGRGGEVAVHCSPDRGVTWVALPRPHGEVNGHQMMPALAAVSGKVSVAWYDSRSEPAYTASGPVSGSGAGRTGRGMDVFYNQRASAGCAGGWEGELRVTTQSFNPNLFASIRALTPFIGDYIAVVADREEAFVVWADNRDINGEANAQEDGDPATNPAALINARSRDSNVYFQKISK